MCTFRACTDESKYVDSSVKERGSGAMAPLIRNA